MSPYQSPLCYLGEGVASSFFYTNTLKKKEKISDKGSMPLI